MQSLTGLVEEADVEQIISAQMRMLSRFEKTNEMLVNCNALAAIRFESTGRDLRRHIGRLQELKKDIDSVFKRIRFLRSKLGQQYPEAFQACSSAMCSVEEDDEEEEEFEDRNRQDPPISTAAAAVVD